jgi:hypothetical protein
MIFLVGYKLDLKTSVRNFVYIPLANEWGRSAGGKAERKVHQ